MKNTPRNDEVTSSRIGPDEVKKPVPFLKWAGGKRWLIENHASLFDVSFDRFIEPFLGSGAVFFGIAPKVALLSDKNKALIDTYRAIASDWASVATELRRHHRRHDADYYYTVRSASPLAAAKQAARFIYLNRTCWNGLYRVNLEGKFNVPVGTKTSVILGSDDFEGMSSILGDAELSHCDFEKSLRRAEKGDFVFVDPPYTVLHNTNGFVKYNESLFTWDDQVRLRDEVASAVRRGAKVLVTNAAHESVSKLYRGLGTHWRLRRPSVISGVASRRGIYEELIVKCY